MKIYSLRAIVVACILLLIASCSSGSTDKKETSPKYDYASTKETKNFNGKGFVPLINAGGKFIKNTLTQADPSDKSKVRVGEIPIYMFNENGKYKKDARFGFWVAPDDDTDAICLVDYKNKVSLGITLSEGISFINPFDTANCKGTEIIRKENHIVVPHDKKPLPSKAGLESGSVKFLKALNEELKDSVMVTSIQKLISK